MTNEEAIAVLMNSNEYHHAKGDLPHSALTIEAFNMAIKALEAGTKKCPIKGQPNGDAIKLLKGIIDSYTNSPKGIFCKEVPITEQEIEAIKYVYNILKEGDAE